MAGDGTLRLTPKVRALVVTDRLDPPPIGRLTAAHVDALIAVATRPEAFDEPVKPHRAIQALAAGGRPEVVVPVLARVAGDAAAPTTARVVAARELGHIATPEAEAALRARLRAEDPRVVQAALAGLGEMAGPESLRALVKLPEPQDEAARRQLVLARALIAHRHGLDGPFLPAYDSLVRQPGPPEEMISLTLSAKTAPATRRDRKRLLGPSFGIELADHGYELHAGRAEWTVFVNRDLDDGPRALGRMFERPWLTALLGRWMPARVAPTVQYLVLTRPEGDGARIDVVRRDGEVMYTGTAEQVGAAVAFAVGDVERPATAPTTVTGQVAGGRVDLDVTVPFGSRIGTRTTVPAVAD